MFASIVTATIAVAKAIPVIDQWLRATIEVYLDLQTQRSEAEDNQKRDERIALLSALKRSETDDERKNIARAIYRNYRK
jgi:hypothetical protein